MSDSTHLSVLFVAPEQHVRRGLQGKITHRILLDDAREGFVGLALMRWGRGGGGVLKRTQVRKHIRRGGKKYMEGPLIVAEGL